MSLPSSRTSTSELGNSKEAIEQYESTKIHIHKALEAFSVYAYALQELLTARKSLADALDELYTVEGGILQRHASEFSDHLASYLDPNGSTNYLSKLKKATVSCRTSFNNRFAVLDEIIQQSNEVSSKKKEKAETQLVSELAAWSEQKLDLLDPVLVKAMDADHMMGEMLLLPTKQVKLKEEARRLTDAKAERVSPKVDPSFKNLLKNPISVEYLKYYFKERLMAEGLQFWQDVQRLQELQDPVMIENYAKDIYQQYILDTGTRAVNLAAEYANPLHKNFRANKFSSNMYADAARSIFGLLEDNLGDYNTTAHHRRMMAHFQPLRSVQEFMASIGGTSSKIPARRSTMTSSTPLRAFSSMNSTSESESPPDNMAVSTTLDLQNTSAINEASITFILPAATEVLAACLDGSIRSLKFEKQTASISSSEVVPAGIFSGKIIQMCRLSVSEVIIVTDTGAVNALDLTKSKISYRIGKSDSVFSGVLRLHEQRICTWSGRTIQDWVWNSKKKKFAPIASKDLQRSVTFLLKVENSIWAGDEQGGILRLNLQTLHPLSVDRIKVSSSPVLFLHKSDHSVMKSGLNSVTTRVWVSCKDSSLIVYDSDGSVVTKLQSVHDLPVTTATNFEKYVALGSEDGTISIWNREKSEFIERVGKAHKDSISAMCSETNLLYTAALDRTVAVWKAKSKRQIPPMLSRRSKSKSWLSDEAPNIRRIAKENGSTYGSPSDSSTPTPDDSQDQYYSSKGYDLLNAKSGGSLPNASRLGDSSDSQIAHQ